MRILAMLLGFIQRLAGINYEKELMMGINQTNVFLSVVYTGASSGSYNFGNADSCKRHHYYHLRSEL